MFEQPEPTPDARGRRIFYAAAQFGALLTSAAILVVSGQSLRRLGFKVGGAAVFLLLIGGPVVIGRWLARRRR